MATTTRLVTQIFDSLFQGEIDDKSGQGSKRRRCGICEVLWLCDLILQANLENEVLHYRAQAKNYKKYLFILWLCWYLFNTYIFGFGCC